MPWDAPRFTEASTFGEWLRQEGKPRKPGEEDEDDGFVMQQQNEED